MGSGPIADIEGTGGLTYREFLAGCRRYAHWFQPWVGHFRNGRLQNDISFFLDDPRTGADCYFELPRGHTKTVTLCHRLAWEIGNNPNIRIKYVGVNDEEANLSVKLVAQILQSDEFQEIFPGVVDPGRKLGTEGFTVDRSERLRDPTLQGVGIFGNAGGRCDLLVFDDVCNLKNAVMQPAHRAQVINFVDTNWLPTRDWSNEENGKPAPRTWRWGTPYHVSDVTAKWREEHRAKGTLFRRPVVNYVSPWSEVMKPDLLRRLRVDLGPIAYARAYELVPVSSDQLVFPLDWIVQSMFTQMPDHVRRTGRRIASIDLAYTEKSEKKERPDWSVFLTGIRALNGETWIDRMWRMRCAFPQFVDVVARNSRSLGVREMTVENVGAQRVLAAQIRSAVGCTVRGLERDKDKITRAADVQDYMMVGKFHVRSLSDAGAETVAIPELQPLVDEMASFPAADTDDCVDCGIDIIGLARSSGSGSGSTPLVVTSQLPRHWRIHGR